MAKPRATISVALATYNGALHLEDQLNSIINQTVAPTEVVISDDGSSDDTLALARRLLSASNLKFQIIEHEFNKGFSCNFNSALMRTTGEIVFVCDQDDVWLPNKIEYFLANANFEDFFLIMSDMTVVDRELNVLLDSFLNSTNIPESEYAYGCNMAIGRRLLDLALPVPHEFIQHDIWLSMLANLLNAKKILPEPSILYRRHERNVTDKLAGQRESLREIISSAQQFRARMLERKKVQCIALDRVQAARDAGYLSEDIANKAQLELMQDLEISTARSSGSTFRRAMAPHHYFRLYANAGLSQFHLFKDTLLLNPLIQREPAKRW